MSTTNEKYREDLTAYLWDKAWPKYKDAPYSFFLISIELMYKFGAAIWLNRLGYKFEKVNLA